MDFKWDVCGVSVWGVRGSPLGRPGPLMGRPWVVRGLSVSRRWGICGTLIGHPRNIHGLPMDYPCDAHGTYIGHPWGAHALCVGRI